jgi:hypothetical protein
MERDLMAQNTPLAILYIAGAGRSGSTLLGDVLGQWPGALHVGELRGVFDYTMIPDGVMPCSCGNAYEACNYWNPIFEEVFGPDWVSAFQDLKIEGHLPRSLRLPSIARRKRLNRNDLSIQYPQLSKVFHAISVLLERLRERVAASVIVDTSKSGSFGWLLAQQPNVSMIAVHLVRDPRATLFSWLNRPIPLLEPYNGKWRASLRTLDALAAVTDWIRANGSAWLMKWLGIPYMRIRYETFIGDPARSIERILEFARRHGMPLADDETLLSQLNQRRIELGERHLIGSNPGVKSRSGTVRLKEDLAWLRETPWPRRLLWTLVFLPWLVWLGYRLWPVLPRDGAEAEISSAAPSK